MTDYSEITRESIILPERAARMASLTPQELQAAVNKGTFPQPVQIGAGRLGFKVHQVREWVNRRKVNNQDATVIPADGKAKGDPAGLLIMLPGPVELRIVPQGNNALCIWSSKPDFREWENRKLYLPHIASAIRLYAASYGDPVEVIDSGLGKDTPWK